MTRHSSASKWNVLSAARLLGRALAVAASLAVATAAQAGPINISTGTDGSGGVLADGTVDPNWQISVAGGPFTSAVVIFPADECCGMETVDTTKAKWINNVTNPNATFPNGTPNGWNNNPYTVIRRTFDLTGYDLSTVGLNGIWRVADGIQGAFLNGNLLFTSPAYIPFPNQNIPNWTTDHPFSVVTGSPFFVAGVNTLEFQTETINGIYDGLYLNAVVDGRLIPTAPEPASLGLLATGVLALVRVRRRRTR